MTLQSWWRSPLSPVTVSRQRQRFSRTRGLSKSHRISIPTTSLWSFARPEEGSIGRIVRAGRRPGLRIRLERVPSIDNRPGPEALFSFAVRRWDHPLQDRSGSPAILRIPATNGRVGSSSAPTFRPEILSRLGSAERSRGVMNCLVKILTSVLLMVLLHSIPWAFADEPRTWKLDDFEDGDLKAAPGLSWFLIADDLAGGASEARLELRQGGPAGSKHALRLVGRLDGSRGWPFAGAWASLDGSGRSVDLGKFTGIRLRVKGPARLQVGFR